MENTQKSNQGLPELYDLNNFFLLLYRVDIRGQIEEKRDDKRSSRVKTSFVEPEDGKTQEE